MAVTPLKPSTRPTAPARATTKSAASIATAPTTTAAASHEDHDDAANDLHHPLQQQDAPGDGHHKFEGIHRDGIGVEGLLADGQ